ncbi:TetR/AcrR family transcriptional regulator [Novosphingobium sp. TH158]|uniref:TetR/AcrR family transcriptional regulator n=1 Tax=Novosphingobium sp. TH158 TaxID=2067455 RepID=UPI000C7C3927|nr:TetR/AcrR family transcriptional regulator [Novosphingobium sp. TH158]PLK26636.1 TetR/AcrR family transcriptional regulator [Novosphingobium sp. TH158]
MQKTRTATRKRNRGFEETHQSLIETAVRLLSEKGVEALSVSALAREAGLNRTTVYYHFPSREAMLVAVKEWSTQQITRGMDLDAPQIDRMAAINHFVLANPELIKLWIDDFIAPGEIRERYPRWDELVSGLEASLKARYPDEAVDAEVYAVMMMASAIIGPRILQNSVARGEDIDRISERFVAEHRRVLRRDGIIG